MRVVNLFEEIYISHRDINIIYLMYIIFIAVRKVNTFRTASGDSGCCHHIQYLEILIGSRRDIEKIHG